MLNLDCNHLKYELTREWSTCKNPSNHSYQCLESNVIRTDMKTDEKVRTDQQFYPVATYADLAAVYTTALTAHRLLCHPNRIRGFSVVLNAIWSYLKSDPFSCRRKM